jgi:hypothetical protein
VSAVLSELVDQLPQRAVGQAELLRNILRCSRFDKHGAECFVAALMRIGWLSEERAAGGVLHDPFPPKVSMSFAEEPGRIVNLLGQPRRYELAPNRVKTDFSPAAVHAHALRHATV